MTDSLRPHLDAIEQAIRQADRDDLPGISGELERLKGVLLERLVRVPTQVAADSVDDRLLTVQQVAECLGLKEGYIMELARRGEFPSVRMGKYVRFRQSSVWAWVRKHEDSDLDKPLSVTYIQQNGRIRGQANTKKTGPDPGGVGGKGGRAL